MFKRSLENSDTSPPSAKRMKITEEMSHERKLDELPLNIRTQLIHIWDNAKIWRDLAKVMGYEDHHIKDFEKYEVQGQSAANELLTNWTNYSHSIVELFKVLYKIQEYESMRILKPVLPSKYHRHIPVSEFKPDLTKLLNGSNDSTQEKILNGPPQSSNSQTDDTTSGNESSVESVTKNISAYASSIPKINFQELADATNNWSQENFLGKGGFGIVFKGKWKFTEVAIKKILKEDGISMDFLNELKYLNSFRHDNILPLYGYSINGNETCLIYQLMAGGSLQQRLNPKKHQPLNWNQRHRIMLGTARGLQYLHTMDKPLIHADIKPGNILLDACLEPRLGDFGLSREGRDLEVSKIFGTSIYLPHDFIRSHNLSTKVDVFSYGIVMLEIATGLMAYDKQRAQNKHRFLKYYMENAICHSKTEDLIDKSVDYDEQCLRVADLMVRLGMLCTKTEPHLRPEMVFVLSNLDSFKWT